MNKSKDLNIALFTGLILIATSFIPLIQILLFQLNGLIFYPVTVLLPDKGIYLIMAVNGVMSVYSLILFYKAKTIKLRIIAVLVLTTFLLPLFMLFSENIIAEEPYFLQILLGGLLIGLLLLIVALLKSYTIKSLDTESN